ncbi:uncharacterized protein LOC121862887 isoform X2 [Homarus americanus]|uniref:uncharacterized protein LOC121862887 isoform X2 n=1 Tax=Homarus americanus TaxID=6706 RepID=UPI001C495B73|nr:uncharacterized protein LOC121862887 isoform X2 [Homarus americanus]
MAADPPGLVLQSVKASDHAEYRCRVDFRSSPTRNVRIQLEVIVPPKKIKILSEAGLEVSGVIGPYPVGASISLDCQVESGRPRPTVSWFHEEKLLDEVSEVRRGEMTSNTLHLPSLTRDYLYRVLTCQASNSNLSVPVAATVTLDMSYVRIMGTMESLSEGERYSIVCESSGSRPTATITWWKDGMLMTDTKSQVFHEGNVSRSTLYLTPTLGDHDAHVSCRAKNPMVPAAVLEDTRKLNVHYTPRLSLAAGLNLDMEDIKEGDDVYFECGIKANPPVYKVQWFHNGDELSHNVSAGIILSNQSLVLQRVTRRSSGQYTCSATNLHGLGSSNAVQLSVKFAPLCRPGQKFVYGGGKHEELNITCSVEAHPEPTSFRWAFNSSSEIVDIPSSKFWVVGNGKSQASYTPRTHLDYGSLLCWGNNDVGRQLKPCIYHIIHAAPPDPVNNCTVENVTSTGASIRCQAGWDGGLSQTFTLSVSHARAHTSSHDKKEAPRVLANTSTSPKPDFSLTGLEPGTEYILTIMGVNKKGESEPMRMAIFTLKDVAEKRTSPGVGALALTPILAVLLGVLASLLLMALVIALVVRSRRPRARKPEVKMVYDKGSAASVPLRGQDDTTSSDDHNPDLIPVNDDHQVKDLQQSYTTETLPMTDIHLQQHSPVAPSSPQTQMQVQQTPQQQQHMKEYLQGHDGSFYINPGTLLRQVSEKGVLLPRETDPILHMGCPLAASTPAARTTQPTVSVVSTSSSGTDTPESMMMDVSSSFKMDKPKRSTSRSFKEDSHGSFKRDSRRSFKKDYSGSFKKDSPGSFKLDSSKRSTSGSFKLDVTKKSPSGSYKSGSGSFKLETPKKSPSRNFKNPTGSFKLDIPGSMMETSYKETPSSFRRESPESFKLEIPSNMRRNSCGTFTTESSVSMMRESPGSFKLDIPGCVRKGSYGNVTPRDYLGIFRRESSGSFKLEAPGYARKGSSGSCKLHTPQKSPSGSFKSPTGSFKRESLGNFKLETPKKSPSGSFKKESPGSFKLDTPQRSPSGSFKRESLGSFKLETPKKSPSDSFKNTSGSFKLHTPQRSPSGSFKREFAGSVKLTTPRNSPSGSFKSPSGSSKSPSGSFKLETQSKSPSGSMKKESPGMKRESPGSFKVEALGGMRKSSSGICKRESQRSIKLDAPGTGAVMMYSPGSKRRDILGNFKIDSSTEGALVVTQMSSPLHRPGFNKPDKLRIVCPLDSKIRIELKMD